MSAAGPSKWYHANKYTAEEACAECGGIVRHACWCAVCNPAVAYAYDIVGDGRKVTTEDQLILHALGVAWI
jgi:hypothetical protein